MGKATAKSLLALTPPPKRRGRQKMDTPQPIDIHVGQRVRQRRTLLGMSQEALGKAIGLTFQQVQKYERGANRIGASRLWDIATALDATISYFFEEFGDTPTTTPDNLHKRETLELVRAYYRITDPHVRRSVFDHVKALGGK